jgi:hypothetical protein
MRKPLGRGLSLIVQLERLGRPGSHYSLHGRAARGGSGWVALGIDKPNAGYSRTDDASEWGE